eukprot:c9538_g1_i1.p1 GENE.c9538_g1_i1~~c9538_g1_i1.p1  ORF type:complete len:469 (+),score=95.14 c9538_g1_i1:148-1407(+)
MTRVTGLQVAFATLALCAMLVSGLRLPLTKTKNSDAQILEWARIGELRRAGVLPPRDMSAKYGAPKGGSNPVVPLENYYEEIFIANITVGTPEQGPFAVVMDSGSSNTWIPSILCKTPGCDGKPRYNQAASTSANNDPDSRIIAIPYGTGFVVATLLNDNIQIGGVTVDNCTLGQADVMAAFFEDTPLDGISGLGFKDISEPPGLPTLFDDMIANNLLTAKLFQFYMNTDDAPYTANSALVFGEIDTSYARPGAAFVYSDVLPSYWLITFSSTMVGGSTNYACKLGHCLAVVDSGTSIIAGPGPDIDPMISAIGPVASDCSNLASLPDIAFEIGGVSFPVPPQAYVIMQTFSNGTSLCQLGMESIPEVEAGPLWILGVPFLLTYTAVFTKNDVVAQVGFAPSINNFNTDARFAHWPRAL